MDVSVTHRLHHRTLLVLVHWTIVEKRLTLFFSFFVILCVSLRHPKSWLWTLYLSVQGILDCQGLHLFLLLQQVLSLQKTLGYQDDLVVQGNLSVQRNLSHLCK